MSLPNCQTFQQLRRFLRTPASIASFIDGRQSDYGTDLIAERSCDPGSAYAFKLA